MLLLFTDSDTNFAPRKCYFSSVQAILGNLKAVPKKEFVNNPSTTEV
jgi:hypothetical protein